MAERFTGNAFKYTEGELKARGIGVCYDAQRDAVPWNIKKATYTNEGVWKQFTALRDSFRALLRDADGVSYTEYAQRLAQIMMDAFLVKRSRGERVAVPREVVPVNATSEGIELMDAGDFSDRKNVSENEKLRWVFENMQLADVRPEDAPSAGAWALLQTYREDNDARRDFYKNTWPKLLTKEDAEKGGKLNDSGKEAIELIERLEKALESEEK